MSEYLVQGDRAFSVAAQSICRSAPAGLRSLGAGSTAEMSRHRSASMLARRRYVMSSRGPPNRDLSPQTGASPEFTAMKTDDRTNQITLPGLEQLTCCG